MKTIFDPAAVSHLSLKNRLIRSATWENMANSDGSISDALIQTYQELAAGGIGTIITGFTSVSSNDYYFGGMMRLSSDALIPQYSRLAAAVKAQGSAIITQLALGAYFKLDSTGTLSPVEPDELSPDDLQDIKALFVQAAVRAQKAGFDGIQIHAAHNFFLSRFISPAYNHRTDAYGGSLQKRSKLLLEIYQAIRAATTDLHISIKINCSDFIPNGLTPAESLLICQELSKQGIDSIEVSGNGTSRSQIQPHVNEAYFRSFAEKLAACINTPVILVGGHRSIESMNDLLNQTSIELLSLSRPLIREPSLPNRWKSGDIRPSACISCNACYNTPGHKCAFVLRGLK